MLFISLLIGQVLLSDDSTWLSGEIYPYGIWALSTMFVALVPILFFQGDYLRLEKDQERLLDHGSWQEEVR
jgi:hypothetical protein